MDSLTHKMLKEFPTTQGMTQKQVAKFLVDNNWIEQIQKFTYDSVKATGLPVGTLDEFKHKLMKMEVDGKVINAWHNSYERQVARRITKSLKKHTRTLNQRIAMLDNTEDIGKVFKTIKKPSKAMKASMRQIERQQASQKTIDSVRDYVTKDIVNNQYKMVVNDTMDKTANYQGKRIAQDQFMERHNEALEEAKIGFDNTKTSDSTLEDGEEMVIVGLWKLSPSHKWHSKNDPCEKFARIRKFYGNDIPIPKKDTHFGCHCSCEIQILPKSEADKL